MCDGDRYICRWVQLVDMPIAGTTVGPLRPETRDRLATYRDEMGYPHYQAAIEALLEGQEIKSES